MERTKLTRLEVSGYRSLVDLDLELRDLNVLIGPNGVGKTSALEVCFLHRRMADERDGLGDFVHEGGGGASLLTYDALSGLEVRTTYRPALEGEEGLRYHLRVESSGIDTVIREQWLDVEHADGRWVRLCAGEGTTHPQACGEMPVTELAGADSSRPLLAQPHLVGLQCQSLVDFWRDALFYEPVPTWRHGAPFRHPQTLRPAQMPGTDGDDFLSAVHSLKNSHPGAYERLEEAIAAGFPRFKELRMGIVGEGVGQLAWWQDGLQRPLSPRQLSPGMLRYLWLCTILLAPKPPPLILIDEPEVSMHPQLLLLLAELLQDAATRCQLIVATQSAELIRWLEPGEVVVLDQEEDDEGKRRTVARRGDEFHLDDWLKEYTLGEAWSTGMMGGRS